MQKHFPIFAGGEMTMYNYKKGGIMKITNIIWDTDGYDVEALYLPTETYVPSEVEEDEIADWLSDEYGFLVESFLIEL